MCFLALLVKSEANLKPTFCVDLKSESHDASISSVYKQSRKVFFCVCEEQPECSRLETVIFFTSVKQEIIGAVNSH